MWQETVPKLKLLKIQPGEQTCEQLTWYLHEPVFQGLEGRVRTKTQLSERAVICLVICLSFVSVFSGSVLRSLSDSYNFSYPFAKLLYSNSHSLMCALQSVSCYKGKAIEISSAVFIPFNEQSCYSITAVIISEIEKDQCLRKCTPNLSFPS